MNSREIVQRTLDFENPRRVARSFDEPDLCDATNTVKTAATEWQRTGNGGFERIDEWGNLWRRIDETSKGEVVRGVLEDLSDAEGYEFPDYSDPADYAPTRQLRAEKPDKWLCGSMPGFAFNIARKLRRLEHYLVDLVESLGQLHEIHDRIDGLLGQMIDNYAKAGADAVMFPEDWGTQTQTMISPVLWRKEFLPRYRKLCSFARARGIRVFMHSCGQIEAIVPDLIEAGIDLLQFDQPDLHGIDTLAAHQQGAKITFWCPVDIQKVLPTADEQLIRAKARELLDKLWRGRGGFIAGYYDDNPSIGIDPSWQRWASDEFIRHGQQ